MFFSYWLHIHDIIYKDLIIFNNLTSQRFFWNGIINYIKKSFKKLSPEMN